MQIHFHDTADSFYHKAFGLLCAHEAENCWPIGLLNAQLAEPTKKQVTFWTIEEAEQVLGAAWLSNQQVLGVTRMPREVGRLVAHELVGRQLRPTGVAGPREICDAFVDAWRQHIDVQIRHTIEHRLHQLDAVEHLPPCRGEIRVVSAEDRQLLIEWERNFCIDCHLEANEDQLQASVESAIKKGNRYLWIVDGSPCSMAEHRGETSSGIRISYVYTLPSQRGQGYATALVGQLSQKMLDSGKKLCFLYTDIENSTSNHIYRKIGYRPVCDLVHHLFAEEAT